MDNCRVCSSNVTKIFYSAPRSIMSITKPIDEPISVYLCDQCGHGQSDDIDFDRYYSQQYRFQLQSAEHDQLHAVIDGNKIYRADLQVYATLSAMDIPLGAKVLDYGAAKASTLKKLCAKRPDLVPHVFDVSDDYAAMWSEWISADRQSTFSIPESWEHRFDAVLAFFVMEHVEKPNDVISKLSTLLNPNGKLLIIVPNPIANVGDFAVIEHVSHFTVSSLVRLLNGHGLSIDNYSSTLFSGAHVIVASWHKSQTDTKTELASELRSMKDAAAFLAIAQIKVTEKAKASPNRPCAIYGAGVYGNYIATRIEKHANLKAFVDRNPQLWGMSEFGIPIIGPDELPPEVDLVYAGVNPDRARDWLSSVPEWEGRKIEIVYLDLATT